MPKLLYARPPADAEEERKIRKLAGSRHAPADWVMRARMIVASWDGERTSTIAARLGCHMQTVRERLARFAAEGIDGLGDRPGGGNAASPRPSGVGSSRWPAPGHRAAPHGPPVGTCAPRTRRHPRSGPSTVWPRPPRPRGSGCSAARCGGSCWPNGCAGGTPVPGRPVLILTSPQKGGGRRALHRPAAADHGELAPTSSGR
jgi:Winged helix-turn helix